MTLVNNTKTSISQINHHFKIITQNSDKEVSNDQ